MALGDLPTPPTAENLRPGRADNANTRRNSIEEIQFRTPQYTYQIRQPGVDMPYEHDNDGREQDISGERRRRESTDDAKRDEYWRGYYDRKRREKEKQERESEYLPELRGHHRYLEYGDDRGPAPRGYRSNSLKISRAPVVYRGTRPLSFMSEQPTRRYVETHDPDPYPGDYVVKVPQQGPPSSAPPRKPSKDSLRIPFTSWMSHSVKGHFVAAMGEFVGTTMFLFFAFAGTQVAKVDDQSAQARGPSPQVLLYISLVFGFSLMVNVWIFFRISGGLFNPAVTLAMAMTRAITVFRAILLLIMQIAGSLFASVIVKVLFPADFNVRTTLSAGTSLTRGVFIEAILTFELVFTIFLLAKEKHKATFIAPIGIGLALFIAELVGVFYTGGSLNPARSFGPCVISGIWDKEHWIYWVGPGAGALAAVVFYKFIKILEYETANPGQDGSSEDQVHKQAEEAAVRHKHEQMV